MFTVLRRIFRRIDAVVLLCALGLSTFSVVLLLGIQHMGVIGRRTVLMQVIAAVLGFTAAMVLAHLDYERLGEILCPCGGSAYAAYLYAAGPDPQRFH